MELTFRQQKLYIRHRAKPPKISDSARPGGAPHMVGIIRRGVLRRPAQGQGVPHADGALSVGADLRVRPPVLGAHIGAPLHGGGGSFRSTWLPPSRGKLSAERLTDEGAHGDNGRSFPLPPHPSFAPQMPPFPQGEGRARRVVTPRKKASPAKGEPRDGRTLCACGRPNGAAPTNPDGRNPSSSAADKRSRPPPCGEGRPVEKPVRC